MSRTGIVAWVGLGCAAGAVAAALVLRGTLSTLEGKVAALERAAAKPAVPQKSPEVAEVKERLVAMHDEVVAARSQAAEVAMELARTQGVLARQGAFAGFEHRLLGKYVSAPEASLLLPEGSPDVEGNWLWVEFSPQARGMELLEARSRARQRRPGLSLAMCAKGVVTAPGRFGHMSHYRQMFLVTELLALEDAAAAACKRSR